MDSTFVKILIFYLAASMVVTPGWMAPNKEKSDELEENREGYESDTMGRVAPPSNLNPIRQPGTVPIINRPGSSNVNPPSPLVNGGPGLSPAVVPVVPGPGSVLNGANTLQIYFPPVIITVDPTSQLYIPPGAEGRIVVNLRNDGIGDLFFVSGADDKAFFIGFEFSQVQLGQGQSINVPGRIRVPAFATGVVSTLTVFVQRRTDGAQSRKQIYLRARSETGDVWAPWCTMRTVTRCEEYIKESICNQRFWNFRAEIQDTDAGLLSVSLKPEGRYIGEDFIVGTKQSVAVEQSVSCCTTAVDIKAVDTRGNTVTCRADQYSVLLGTGEIVAVVLGIILLIILIIIAVVLIYRCCKRRKSVSTSTIPRKKRDQQ